MLCSSVPTDPNIQCLAFLCNELAFINSNPNAFIGYTAWAAGGFSPIDYNLTMTPKGTVGNFTDQETVRQCVVGTRRNSTTLNTTSASVEAGLVTTAGSQRVRVEMLMFGVLGLLAVLV